MPKLDLHVPHIQWMEYEEIWDDWLCQGWVFGRNPTTPQPQILDTN